MNSFCIVRQWDMGCVMWWDIWDQDMWGMRYMRTDYVGIDGLCGEWGYRDGVHGNGLRGSWEVLVRLRRNRSATFTEVLVT